MHTTSLQSSPTLDDPMDCSPPGSSVHRDSPGKNTGVGCHDLLQGIFPTQGSNPGLPHCRQILEPPGKLVTQLCLTLCDPMDCSPSGFSVHRDSPGKNTRVVCHSLLQGIFQTQGLSLGLLHCRQILHHLSHQGSPMTKLPPKGFISKCHHTGA